MTITHTMLHKAIKLLLLIYFSIYSNAFSGVKWGNQEVHDAQQNLHDGQTQNIQQPHPYEAVINSSIENPVGRLTESVIRDYANANVHERYVKINAYRGWHQGGARRHLTVYLHHFNQQQGVWDELVALHISDNTQLQENGAVLYPVRIPDHIFYDEEQEN